MTDREEFEKWWKETKGTDIPYTGLASFTEDVMFSAWQARGALDAVKIRELEADLDDRKREVNLRCGQIQERDIRIAELTAKLDKAREAFGEIVLGKVFDQDIKDFCQTTLEELDK